MTLKETQTKWGNLYRRYYFLNGRRISEAYANYLLKRHAHETLESGNNGKGQWVTVWNLGPCLDAMYDLYDETIQTKESV